MQKIFLLIATMIGWISGAEEKLANRPLPISFWPGVSWESKNLATSPRRPSFSAETSEKKNLEDNEILNRIRERLRNCFMQPFECQMEPLTQKGTILLQKLHEQLDIESPLESGELRRLDETRRKMELARTFRNYHSHFLYNPLFRLQAFNEMKHKKNINF